MNETTSTAGVLWRGLKCRCPRCGIGKVFSSFTTVRPACLQCGLDLSLQRADDAPPYLVIVIVGHVIVPLALVVDRWHPMSSVVHLMIWMPLSLALSLALLPPMKGLVIAIQWLNGMHGFNRS